MPQKPLEKKTVNPNYKSPGLLPSPVDYCLGIYEDNPPVNPSSSNYCIIVSDFYSNNKTEEGIFVKIWLKGSNSLKIWLKRKEFLKNQTKEEVILKSDWRGSYSLKIGLKRKEFLKIQIKEDFFKNQTKEEGIL